jgi:hypothetical protein
MVYFLIFLTFFALCEVGLILLLKNATEGDKTFGSFIGFNFMTAIVSLGLTWVVLACKFEGLTYALFIKWTGIIVGSIIGILLIKYLIWKLFVEEKW